MLHRYLGIEPHKKKERIDPIVTNKLHDATKMKRKIVPSWKAEFFWLVVDDTEEVRLNISDLSILLIHDAQHSGLSKLYIIHQTTSEMIPFIY